MKYIVWCPGRCGSMLASRIIWHAYFAKNPSNGIHFAYHNDDPYYGNANVIHAHSYKLFNTILDYQKIVMSRPIIDSVLSRMIANITKIEHVSLNEKVETLDLNSKFEIPISTFAFQCNRFNDAYTAVDNAIDKNYQIIRYNDIKDSPIKILDQLNDPSPIDYKMLTADKLPIKMPVSSFERITNIQEVIDFYTSLNLKYKNGL